MSATLPYLTRKMIELTPVRLMRVVKKTKARVHTSLINLTMVIRYTVILADKHTLQNEEKRVFRVKKNVHTNYICPKAYSGHLSDIH